MGKFVALSFVLPCDCNPARWLTDCPSARQYDPGRSLSCVFVGDFWDEAALWPASPSLRSMGLGSCHPHRVPRRDTYTHIDQASGWEAL